MPPDTTEKNVNHSTKLFGLGREGKRPGDPLVVTENTTAWGIYNHKAAEVDRELIKDWNDSLNTLLIFTALYSAVLTAFIVESMKLLEEDPTETTRDILLVVSRQLANNSFPPFEPVVYQTPQYAIAVNGLFFTSLSCALIAALLAVLALQWVANYDMGLNTSAPKKRALQRHIRFRGIEKWKMSELIASLPLLIFVSLFLFFIGIADWLWHMNRAISGIVIGGIGVGVILYTVTNLISIINVDAPFRTPVSKELIGIMRQLIEKIRKIVASFSLSPTAADTQKHTIEETIGQPLTFMQREEKTFEGKDGVVLDSLAWLARNIEIATIAADSFIVLLKELTNVSALSLMDSKAIEDAPWNAIFEMLCTLYIDKKGYNPEELEAMRWVCKGMGIIPANFLSPTFHKFLDDLHVSCDESASGLAYFALYKQYHDQDTELWQCAWMMISAYAHISKTISQIGDNYFHFMLLHTKQKWPNLDMDNQTLLVEAMARAWTISSAVIRDGSSPVTVSFPLIELVFDIVVPHVEDGKFEARYLAARNANTWGSEHWQDALDRLLGTMAQQIIHQINHNFNTLSNDMKELDLLSWLIESKQLGLDEQKDDFIWVMIDNFTKHDRSRDLDRITDTLCRGLNCKRASFEWIALVPILDDFLARLPPHSSHFYSNVIRFVERSLGSSGHAENSSDLDGLTQVRDPCLVWIVSWQCPNDVQFDLLTNPNFISWNDAIEDEFIRLFSIYKLGNIEDSDARIHLIRAIILDGPSNACFGILGHLNTYIFGKLSDNEKWHKIFAPPMLNVIFERFVTFEGFPIHSLLAQLANFPWFYEEFSQANGLEWLFLIVQRDMYTENQFSEHDALTEILVDQILSSSAHQDVHVPPSFSYYYLQSIDQGATQMHAQSNHRRLANLQVTLRWLLDNSIKVHDSNEYIGSPSPIVFDPPNLERLHWPTVEGVRSFAFIKDMSDEEWQEWETRLKVLIMGTSLGGLKPGPVKNKTRFCRDPDGICGTV